MHSSYFVCYERVDESSHERVDGTDHPPMHSFCTASSTTPKAERNI